jgi:RecA-family ATPase
MSITEQAQRYIDAIPSAVSGDSGHTQTFKVALALVEGFSMSAAEARPMMVDYSNRCDPPWSEREIDHKLAEAEKLCDPAKRGKLVKCGVKYQSGHKPTLSTARALPVTPRPAPATIKTKAARYEVSDTIELPEPMEDGTRAFIKAAFQEGEGVRIAVARTNEENKEVPKDAGVTLSREEWLRKLDTHKGNPNKFLKTSERNGIFVSVNPMRIGGSKDADVTLYRHALLEFDNISLQEQWGIITASRIPCTAVISSGGKSIHAWVRVDAQDKYEFADRVKTLYAWFADYKPDEKNKNPSRLSRLPNCERGNRRQELLALNPDWACASFTEWIKSNQEDQLGACFKLSDLLSVDTSKDPNCVIGFRDGKSLRYLCKGRAAWLIGPSGIGKSSLISEFALGWAAGNPVFGIQPARPLKSLIVQAENDFYDLAEMAQGIARAHSISSECILFEDINNNVQFKTETTSIREQFAERLHRLIDRERPDIVWVDPLLSFAGIAVSKQEECSMFLRQWMNPVLEATGVVLIGVHHTGKPKSTKETSTWTALDYAYSGIGSSELVNWARAVMVLNPMGDHDFELKLAKRGSRADARHPNGDFTTSVFLKHGTDTIRWHQQLPPEPAEESKVDKEPKLTKPQQIAGLNLATFLSHCTKDGESLRGMMRRLGSWLASKDSPKKSLASSSEGSIRAAVGLMLDNEKLTMLDNLYFKGPKA